MSLFPLFLKLEGQPCLVVGAGRIGEAKIVALLEAGAAVRVVAPEATDRVRQWAREERLEWERRPFAPADVTGMTLVVAALSLGSPVAADVHREARHRRVLCNVVDDPAHCDFYYPARVTRGDLQIAISSGGHSPALAQRLRRELEAQFGPEYGGWLEELGRLRRALFSVPMESEDRRRVLHELASREAFLRRQSAASADEASGRRPAVPATPGRGMIYLVGAGPGDPELLTLKALRVLGSADVVLHDDLVPAELLELVPPGADVQGVGKRQGQAKTSQDAVNAQLVAHAAAGRTVVRLKGGDVSVFGRANEEIQALRAAGTPFEVVPGITAASAAAAAGSTSLTDRYASSAVALVTGQTREGHPPPAWSALAASGATLVVYMPGNRYADVSDALRQGGLAPDTPCLIVSCASQPSETVAETTLAGLARHARLPAPAVLMIGRAVCRPEVSASRDREARPSPAGAPKPSRN